MKEEILLWPGAAPGSAGLSLMESISDERDNPQLPNRCIKGIVTPSLTVYRPEKANGCGVLVIPGGGYTQLVFDKEGTDIAQWLVSLGVTAFVLKLRLPGEGHQDGKLVPLQDAQRAIRLIRHLAPSWGLAPQKIGVMGFSSGGHLAAALGTNFARAVYSPLDETDAESARPDFMLIAYAPISTNARNCMIDPNKPPLLPVEKQELYDEFPADLQVTKATPPTFLVMADDDTRVPSENLIRFYRGLKQAEVPAELHIFMKGGHGFAIRNAKGSIAKWLELYISWLKDNGMLS